MSIQDVTYRFQSVSKISIILFPLVSENESDNDLDLTYRLDIIPHYNLLNSIEISLSGSDVTDLFQSVLFAFRKYDTTIEETTVQEMSSTIIRLIDEVNPESMILTYHLLSPERQVVKKYSRDMYSVFLQQYKKQHESYRSTIHDGEYDEEELSSQVFALSSLAHSLLHQKRLNFSSMLQSLVKYTIQESTRKLIIGKECPVLLEPLEVNDIIILECNHMISKQAFTKMLDTERHPRCPICRRPSCPSDCMSC
jgi:hypothetical protein